MTVFGGGLQVDSSPRLLQTSCPPILSPTSSVVPSLEAPPGPADAAQSERTRVAAISGLVGAPPVSRTPRSSMEALLFENAVLAALLVVPSV